jgi:hypothetical protein
MRSVASWTSAAAWGIARSGPPGDLRCVHATSAEGAPRSVHLLRLFAETPPPCDLSAFRDARVPRRGRGGRPVRPRWAYAARRHVSDEPRGWAVSHVHLRDAQMTHPWEEGVDQLRGRRRDLHVDMRRTPSSPSPPAPMLRRERGPIDRASLRALISGRSSGVTGW